MKLRRLELRDAILMLEWMHSLDITENLSGNFASKTVKDCEKFIVASWENSEKELHMAVTDEFDIYLGTVSLKHMDMDTKTAEFAIAMHKNAIGKGVAADAMQSILEIGSKRLDIRKIYWCVKKENKRAIRFYDKNGYEQTSNIPRDIEKRYEMEMDLLWYVWC